MFSQQQAFRRLADNRRVHFIIIYVANISEEFLVRK